MKRIFGYLSKFKLEAVLAPLFKMLEATFELLVPLVVKRLVDVGIKNNDRGYIIRMCLILVLFCLIGFASAVVAQYFSAKAAVGATKALRHDLFAKVQSLRHSDIDNMGVPKLITHMTSDANTVQTGINMTLRLLLRSPFVVFGAMILAFTVDVRCALIFAVAIPILLFVVFAVTLVTIPKFKAVQGKLGDVLKNVRGGLVGARVIRAFCAEDREKAEFDAENDRLTVMQKRVSSISALLGPATYLLINFAVIILIYTGAIRMEAGLLTSGALLALYDYMSQILVELIKFANFIITLTKSIASAGRLDSFLAEENPRVYIDAEREKNKPFIEFDSVSFGYGNGGAVLSDISFSANRGETVGIIGGTGSGKTTLVNLIPGFYDPTSGSVKIDGLDVRAYKNDEPVKMVGYVPQKAMLFRGTIRDNMRWGKENATDEEMLFAIDRAMGADIVKVKGGLDAEITEGGKNLSGGQRQRLTIARALVRKPEILILDDSASALDYATDAALRKNIRDTKEPPTTFIVSQRSASVMHADKIIVLDEGKIVGMGRHEDLLCTCQIYREIYELQFGSDTKGE